MKSRHPAHRRLTRIERAMTLAALEHDPTEIERLARDASVFQASRERQLVAEAEAEGELLRRARSRATGGAA